MDEPLMSFDDIVQFAKFQGWWWNAFVHDGKVYVEHANCTTIIIDRPISKATLLELMCMA